MKGTLEKKPGLQITVYVGKVRAEGYDTNMELLTSADMHPIIRNMNTGAEWSINWNQLMALAVEEGIDP